MISFRYHLVSIVAMFLFLALGIVIGTTALNGPITKDLRNQVNDAKGQRDRLAGQNKSLQGQVDDAGQFASTYGSKIVAGRLAKQHVLMVNLPGTTSAMRDNVSKQLGAAGATVTGQVTITKDYLDPSLGNGIVSLSTGPAHPLGWTAPETSDPGQLGGSLLAYVLLGQGQKSDLTQVLGGFSELHMVSARSDIGPATTLVVLAKGHEKSYGASAELSLVTDLAKGGKVVVAGDGASAGSGGIVRQVRDAGTRDSVSTVDNANSSFGQVSAVLALADTVKGQVGQYGTQAGADALYPSPAS